MNQQPNWLHNDGLFLQPIVGEHACQEALDEITDCEIDQGESIDLPASLILENSNPHDSNAVQVQILGKAVGYLSRPNAKVFRHKLASLNSAAQFLKAKQELQRQQTMVITASNWIYNFPTSHQSVKRHRR